MESESILDVPEKTAVTRFILRGIFGFFYGPRTDDSMDPQRLFFTNMLCFACGLMFFGLISFDTFTQSGDLPLSINGALFFFGLGLILTPLTARLHTLLPLLIFSSFILATALIVSFLAGPEGGVYWSLCAVPAFCLALTPPHQWKFVWAILIICILASATMVFSSSWKGLDQIDAAAISEIRLITYVSAISIVMPSTILAFFSVINLDRHRQNILRRSLPERLIRPLQEVSGRSPTLTLTETTVLVIDICGFTSKLRTLSAPQTQMLLNTYQAQVEEICSSLNLHFVKTTGDSIIVVDRISPHNIRRPDSMLRLARKISDSIDRAAMASLPSIRINMGLAQGGIGVGIVGTKKVHFDVWGEATNLAFRLQGRAKPGQILGSKSFCNSLSVWPQQSQSLQMDIKGYGTLEVYDLTSLQSESQTR